MKAYRLARPRGEWILTDLENGVERPFGLCPKEDALRRAANFLKSRPGKSILQIHATSGELQSERVYEGLKQED